MNGIMNSACIYMLLPFTECNQIPLKLATHNYGFSLYLRTDFGPEFGIFQRFLIDHWGSHQCVLRGTSMRNVPVEVYKPYHSSGLGVFNDDIVRSSLRNFVSCIHYYSAHKRYIKRLSPPISSQRSRDSCMSNYYNLSVILTIDL